MAVHQSSDFGIAKKTEYLDCTWIKLEQVFATHVSWQERDNVSTGLSVGLSGCYSMEWFYTVRFQLENRIRVSYLLVYLASSSDYMI